MSRCQTTPTADLPLLTFLVSITVFMSMVGCAAYWMMLPTIVPNLEPHYVRATGRPTVLLVADAVFDDPDSWSVAAARKETAQQAVATEVAAEMAYAAAHGSDAIGAAAAVGAKPLPRRGTTRPKVAHKRAPAQSPSWDSSSNASWNSSWHSWPKTASGVRRATSHVDHPLWSRDFD